VGISGAILDQTLDKKLRDIIGRLAQHELVVSEPGGLSISATPLGETM
jgi:hypothetical protein